jgi:hypothetical protein
VTAWQKAHDVLSQVAYPNSPNRVLRALEAAGLRIVAIRSNDDGDARGRVARMWLSSSSAVALFADLDEAGLKVVDDDELDAIVQRRLAQAGSWHDEVLACGCDVNQGCHTCTDTSPAN